MTANQDKEFTTEGTEATEGFAESLSKTMDGSCQSRKNEIELI
jgi:hypothetical protein